MFFNYINHLLNVQNQIFDLNSLILRSSISFIFSFIFGIVGLKYLILLLKKHNSFQPIRSESPEGHLITKQKTPTMGGLIASLALLFSGFLLCNLKNSYILSALFVSISFSITGFIDDFIKVFYKNTNGFKGSIKLVLQITISGIAILWLISNNYELFNKESIFVPFLKMSLYLGILFIPFLITVIVGSGNALNITDGLDGLLIIPVILLSFIFGFISLSTTYNFEFLALTNKENLSELMILCSSITGSGISFFIYNKKPAKIFMGDVGSLMYGAFFGFMAIILRCELFYAIMGLLFVIEALSSILQVASYKVFKKRIFKMAPIHHHFEKMGWSERKVVLIFWMFFLICTLIAISGILNF